MAQLCKHCNHAPHAGKDCEYLFKTPAASDALDAGAVVESHSCSCTAAQASASNKPRFDLIPPHGFHEVAQAFTYGAEKYGDTNYLDRDRAEAIQKHTAALHRHMNAHQRGQLLDDGPGETGLPHIVLVAVNALILRELTREESK